MGILHSIQQYYLPGSPSGTSSSSSSSSSSAGSSDSSDSDDKEYGEDYGTQTLRKVKRAMKRYTSNGNGKGDGR